MTRSTLKACQRWLAPAVLLLAIAAAVGTQTAFARIAQNTIDPVATIAAHGSQVTVTGPLTVTAGESTFLRVTVTQRSTGAIAEGIAFLVGTGATQQWRVTATARTRERFEEGPAAVVALARSSERADATDAHQWLVNVMLVRE